MPCGWAARILRPLSDGFRGPAHHRKQPRGKRSQDAWVTRLLRRGSYRIPVPGATRAWGTLPVRTVVLGHRDSKGPWTQARTLPWGPWRWPQAGGGWGGTPGLPQLSEAGGQCQPPWPICQVGTERAPPWMNQDRRVLAPGASSPLLSPPPRRSPFLSKALLPLEGEKRKKEEKKTLVLAYPDPSPCL